MPLDAVAVNALLDVALKSAQAANLRAINESAAKELAQVNADLEAELRPPPEVVEPPPEEVIPESRNRSRMQKEVIEGDV